MNRRGWWITGLLLSAGGSNPPALKADPPRVVKASAEKAISLPVKLAWPAELNALPDAYRDKIVKVVQSPTLSALAKPEDFVADPKVYAWLLDHPEHRREIGRRAAEHIAAEHSLSHIAELYWAVLRQCASH